MLTFEGTPLRTLPMRRFDGTALSQVTVHALIAGLRDVFAAHAGW
ncbi:hypothetical protein [Corallococcus sp. 4LFB]